MKNQMPTRGTTRKAAPGNYATDSKRWHAVLHRDPDADGKFCYAVKTTGVYCRPSCAARLARRENVQFHVSWEAAERAGFRACQRCQPNGPALGDQYAAKVATACRTIETAEEIPDLNALAKAAGWSRFHFHRVFTKIAGLTPKAYTAAQRAERLRKSLPKRSTVTEAIYEAGFNSNSRFYAKTSEILGMTPKNFRTGGQGETIRFAVGKCSLGAILVAASAKGVCAISLGDDRHRLIKDLQAGFPRAKLIAGDKNFARLITKVVGFVETPKVGLPLPLDVRGTVFQRRVWQALRAIPAGSTASYAQIAQSIGSPKAVRAVAGACAANAIAVAIPCHRVVRTDGSLSGYRWGVERKRALLQREAGAAKQRPRK